MNATRYCKDYGGTKGLTCGYWAHYGNSVDRHVIKYHASDDDVFDINREACNKDRCWYSPAGACPSEPK